MENLTDGVYPNEEVPEELYRTLVGTDDEPRAHKSTLPLEGTMSRWNHSLCNPTPVPTARRDAFNLGHWVHASLLEPHLLCAGCEGMVDHECKAPLFRAAVVGKNGKEKKTVRTEAEWKAIVHDNPDRTPIPHETWDVVLQMRDRTLWTDTGRKLFLPVEEGSNELVVLWTDETTGIQCAARLDRLVTLARFGETIVDVKTTGAPASPTEFQKTVNKYFYHVQAAFYLDGLAIATGTVGEKRDFIFAVCESKPPHDVAFYQLEEEAIIRGRFTYKMALERLRKSRDSGEFAGHADGIRVIGLPPWAKDPDALLEGD